MGTRGETGAAPEGGAQDASGRPRCGPRVGFHVSAFGSHQVLAALSALSRCGFEGLEIYADTSQVFADRPEEFRAISEIAGVRLAGVHGGGLLTSAEFRDAEMAEWRRLVDWVAAAGGAYAVFYGGESEGDPATELTRAAGFLDELGAHAASKGVRLCYEPDLGCPFATTGSIAALLERTDPAHVGLSVDTAHLASMGLDPALYVLSQRNRLSVVHVRDLRDPAAGGADRHGEIGAGTLDLAAVAGTLRSTSFAGWIVGVVDRPEKSAHESAAAAARYFRTVLGLEF